jgi:hypothetical protein
VSGWTPERVERAVQLYIGEGLTAAEVADALGEAFTRAAVIGKMHRLGLGKRELRGGGLCLHPMIRRARPPTPRRTPPAPPPKPLPPLREVGPTGAPKRLAELHCTACRWPIDDPGPGRMHLALFCAGPAVTGPYCAAHAALAVRPRAAP